MTFEPKRIFAVLPSKARPFLGSRKIVVGFGVFRLQWHFTWRHNFFRRIKVKFFSKKKKNSTCFFNSKLTDEKKKIEQFFILLSSCIFKTRKIWTKQVLLLLNQNSMQNQVQSHIFWTWILPTTTTSELPLKSLTTPRLGFHSSPFGKPLSSPRWHLMC